MKPSHRASSVAAFALLALGACTVPAEDSALTSSDVGPPGAAHGPGAPTCGGANAPKCPVSEGCKTGTDCESGVCSDAVCQAPSTTDGVRNGGETDVDCGGASAPKCGVARACATHADCSSDGCAYDSKCAAGRSCTKRAGGDTCGVGEVGDPAAKHVSCCESAPLFGSLQAVKLDKFLITAGRMRAFIERMNGDVRSFVHTLPASRWNPSWDDGLVPSNAAEADIQLGSYFNKKSCHPGDHTGRTYWTPKTPDDFSDFAKEQLDEKALNCVSWHLVAAFCAWDGGRMPTSDELRNAFTQDGQYAQPWLWQPGAERYVQTNEFTAPAPSTTIFNHAFAYRTPSRLPSARPLGADAAYYISPPGRFPTSWNEHGHEIAGNLLTWNASGPYVFSRNFSWENHGGNDLYDSNWKEFQETADIASNAPNGYYAIGGRCARD